MSFTLALSGGFGPFNRRCVGGLGLLGVFLEDPMLLLDVCAHSTVPHKSATTKRKKHLKTWHLDIQTSGSNSKTLSRRLKPGT